MLAHIRPLNSGGDAAPNVCTLTVRQELCVGCGVCAAVCPTGTLRMVWNGTREYIPVDEGRCRKGCHVCVDACPFLNQMHNEDTMAVEEFRADPGVRYRPEAGYLLGLWAGYAEPETARMSGTSGGLARWFLAQLLRAGHVDRVICVQDTGDPSQLLRFEVVESPEALGRAARSAYYPTEMSAVLARVLAEDARYAIVALPCYLKGLRLAMRQNVKLRKRIVLTAGLTCGQMKSAAFADYLTRLAGLAPCRSDKISFREKNPAGPATEYVFRACAGGTSGSVSWTAGRGEYKEAYVTGMFKPRCCDFCDDVFAELADISFMDAWLPRFYNDGRGTNLVVTRCRMAEEVMEGGIRRGEVRLEQVGIDEVLLSQDSVLDHKRYRLPYRLYLADEEGAPRPHKRLGPRKPSFGKRKWIQAAERLRRASHELMRRQTKLAPGGLAFFRRAIKPYLRSYYGWGWYVGRVERYSAAALRRLRSLR